jgi:hypothetical protein
MSDINEQTTEQATEQTTEQTNEQTTEQVNEQTSEKTSEKTNDVIIKLEDIKEPVPLKINDDDIIEITETSKTEFKIEVKPENVLIDGLEHLYSYIRCVHHEKITPTNIIVIATELIQIVEKYKGLTGPQKKMLVINVIKKVVNHQIESDETRKTLNIIIDLTLPIVIDNIISAMNGEIKFNKEKVQSFFKKYICCCFAK